MQRELCEKVKTAARSRHSIRRQPPSAPSFTRQVSGAPAASKPAAASPSPILSVPTRSGLALRDCVAIGVSTGGPLAVQRVLSALPKDFPAYILIAQHMPGTFTGPFAKRLDGVCQISVKEAEDGERPKPGWAYVAPGGRHMSLEGHNASFHLSISSEPASALYKPSATVLMESVGRALGSRSAGVIMTGMGSDGCDGMKVLKQKGGHVIAQNEASCVVYGMPKAVVDAGLADEIVELDKLAGTIAAAVYK